MSAARRGPGPGGPNGGAALDAPNEIPDAAAVLRAPPLDSDAAASMGITPEPGGIGGPTIPVGAATPGGVLDHEPPAGRAAETARPPDGTNLATSSAMPAAHVAQGPIAGAVPAPLVFECAFAPAWPGATDRIDPARMELERHVARRTAELEAANRELEAFSYSVSHDLQAPLRQIDGFVELLVRDAGPTLSAASREILDDISGAARHMATLIDTLLEFSRAGRASLRPVDVNLDVLARDVVRELSRGTAGRAIEWSLGRLPTVRGDRTLLRQVFVNLLANAVKYTRPRARARIEVGTFGPGAAGDVVCFVGDNGVGFDMRRAHRLFGVFQRLHAASDFEGTGIGLASVQRIVHRHGGRVWATGVVGEGATFFFSLPGGIRAGDAAPATGGGGDS